MSDPKAGQDSDLEKAPEQGDEFIAQAGEARGGLTHEFVDFLKDNKKWWLAPIIISILGLGLLVMLGGTAAAPFIYTLF